MSGMSSVLDQNGQPLEGMYDSDPANRARVEIRTTADGIIRPPGPTGAAHPYNPLLAPDSIGGIGMNACEPGLFAMVLSNRPATNTKLFARAFNAPTLADAASFYVDTTVVSASQWHHADPDLQQRQALDSGDEDEDMA